MKVELKNLELRELKCSDYILIPTGSDYKVIVIGNFDKSLKNITCTNLSSGKTYTFNGHEECVCLDKVMAHFEQICPVYKPRYFPNNMFKLVEI